MTTAGLPLASDIELGYMAHLHDAGHLREAVDTLHGSGFDSLWLGDHVAFTSPILDPLLPLAQAAVLSTRLKLGTSVYLAPLRPAAVIAKQAATLDLLSEGRFTLGLGLGGEFAAEFAACGVPVAERGARLDEAIRLMRLLWSGQPCDFSGRFARLDGVRLQPPPFTPGGPRIWCGGRQPAALDRAGRLADGWVSYVVTPGQFAAGLQRIAAAAAAAGRTLLRFDAAHLLFVRLDRDRAAALEVAATLLSRRYGMDFRRAAERYCALGTAAQVAARLGEFHAAGVRTFILDFIGERDEQIDQIERFASEVTPQLAGLRVTTTTQHQHPETDDP